MTIKEFKELVLEAEKKGEINADSEIFVVNDDQDVMSEPDLLTVEKDLILKFSYRNEVLIELDNIDK